MARAIRFFPHILFIFHAVGIVLFVYLAEAPSLSYLNILLSALLVLLSEDLGRRSIMVFVLIFVMGYIIELIGVQTGLLFGSYAYKEAMGPMMYGTPLIIGATWYAVVVGASSIAGKVQVKTVYQALIAGVLAVVMDVMIEKVAINYGLWAWENNVVPLYNYVCWFLFGFLFSLIYLRSVVNHNQTARYLFYIWIGFFGVLNLLV